jgi:hypothetical protein
MEGKNMIQDLAGMAQESWSEGLFLQHLEVGNPGLKWYRQVKVETGFATFWLDAGTLVKPGYALGFECDGDPYHQDKIKDACRDCLIVGTGRLARVYRVSADHVRERYVEWLYLLSEMEPDLVCAESKTQVKKLIEVIARKQGIPPLRGLRISRVCRQNKDVQEFLDFASQNKGIGFRQLVERWKERSG